MSESMNLKLPQNQNNTLMEVQEEFACRVAKLASEKYGRPTAHIHTYGCQQNISDSERIKGLLSEMGFGFVDTVEQADLVLFNTCAIREHAQHRVFGNVGALKHYKLRRPGSIVALCGCMMQQEAVAEKIRKSYPFVDLVFGTHVLYKLPELLYRLLTEGKRVFELSVDEPAIVEGIPVKRDGTFKGWLPIMYGCNNFCSYCIVPYVRGRERSREPDIIINEARGMVAAGYKDITLLGQNVNSYGKGEMHGISFAALLRRINDIEGDFRIRFMTSHPKDCTLELLDAIRDCDKVCKHLHLPVQSGSSSVLKAMNRHYNRDEYLGLISAAKERMPDINLTSDIIVGFPGETYDEFLETISIIKQVGYSTLFTFIFSKRDGTPAALMADPVSDREKSCWFEELLSVQSDITQAHLISKVGKTFRVLVEEEKKEGILFGRTDENIGVEFGGTVDLIGEFVSVTINEAGNWVLRGELAKALG